MVFFPLLTFPPVFLTLLLRRSALPPGAVSRDGQRLDLGLSVKSDVSDASDTDTGWRRLIGCLKLQVIFRKRVTNYRALLRKVTYEDKAS